jgi:hypothetical protein
VSATDITYGPTIATSIVPQRFELDDVVPVGCPIRLLPNRRMPDVLAARRWLETAGGKFAMKFGPSEGAVYFVQSANGGPIKVGWAKDVWKRMIVLQGARPDLLVLRLALAGGRDFEAQCHEALRADRIRGEWFRCTDDTEAWLRESSHGLAWTARATLVARRALQ